jgi:hypothetical protein
MRLWQTWQGPVSNNRTNLALEPLAQGRLADHDRALRKAKLLETHWINRLRPPLECVSLGTKVHPTELRTLTSKQDNGNSQPLE